MFKMSGVQSNMTRLKCLNTKMILKFIDIHGYTCYSLLEISMNAGNNILVAE